MAVRVRQAVSSAVAQLLLHNLPGCRHSKVVALHAWQAECLCKPGVLEGEANLVFSGREGCWHCLLLQLGRGTACLVPLDKQATLACPACLCRDWLQRPLGAARARLPTCSCCARLRATAAAKRCW